MPLYEFECQDCKTNFEKLVRIAGTPQVVCPHCGSAETEKKISLFAASAKTANSFSVNSSSGCAPGGT